MFDLIAKTVSVINGVALSTISVIFGYFVPAICSVKTVIHSHTEGYYQWVTYWVILHIFNIIEPFLNIALHPWLKICLILWLSLPKFQGATAIYKMLIVPALDRYEDLVDERIESYKMEAGRRAFSFVSGAGWKVMTRFGDVIQRARDGSLFLVEEGGAEEEDTGENGKEGDEAELMRRSSTLDPQHSVRDSLLMMERSSNNDEDDDQELIFGFLSMLSRGLFVFASVEHNTTQSTEEVGSNVPIKRANHGIRLRVFSYEEGMGAFAISEVENDDETTTFLPVSKLISLEESDAQGIRIDLEDGLVASIVLSDSFDRDTLLSGLRKCLPVLAQSDCDPLPEKNILNDSLAREDRNGSE